MKRLVLAILAFAAAPSGADAPFSLRFHGNGVNDIDRVKIRIDDPALPADVGPPVDVGATDFTIEFWVKGLAAENTGTVSCGSNSWINGNILIDRDRYNQGRNHGISFGGGQVAFGVMDAAMNADTICGTSLVLDGEWHHVAVQRRRSDGRMQIWVDGTLEAEADGPDGDISYPDDGVPGNFCGGPCVNSDPFIVFGAEKHDAGPSYPSFSGWMDEVRYSTTLRYSSAFVRPTQPFVTDGSTAALYHLDEGSGDFIGDTSGADGGPSDGVRRYGGTPAGPEWSSDVPFGEPPGASFGGTMEAATLVAFPNPAGGAVTFVAAAGAAAPRASLSMYDVTGRQVAVLAGRISGDQLVFEWRPGDSVPGGVYFARCLAGGRPLAVTRIR
jgi:hypothetical protein